MALVATVLVYGTRTPSGTADGTVAFLVLAGVGVIAFAVGLRAGRFRDATVAGIAATVGSFLGLVAGRALLTRPSQETDAYAWLAFGALVLVVAGWGVVAARVLRRRGEAR
jgi:hypothetical protein